NRSAEKADMLAAACRGMAIPWAQLDEALAKADIVLSSTGATQPVVTLERYENIRARRAGGPAVILDVAVPRDFDPRIHDGDRTFLFNIDDLLGIRERTLALRRAHVAAGEAIVEQETARFLKDWAARRPGPLSARLSRDAELVRLQVELRHEGRVRARTAPEKRVQQLLKGGVRPVVSAFTNSIGVPMALVPPGEFYMGSPSQRGRTEDDANEFPRRLVRIS